MAPMHAVTSSWSPWRHPADKATGPRGAPRAGGTGSAGQGARRPALATGAGDAAERLQTMLDAMPTFRALGALPGMQEALDAIEVDLAVAAEALEKNGATDAVLELLEDAEADLLDVDDLAPSSALREALVDTVPMDSEVAHARLLVRNLTPLRLPRAVDAMSRLCTDKHGGILPFDEARDRLMAVGAPSSVPMDTRAAALAFFDRAIRKLDGFRTLEDLITSGLVTEVAGYRFALRRHLLDPEILHASAAVEVAYRRRVYEMGTTMHRAELDARAADARRVAESAFNVVPAPVLDGGRFVRRHPHPANAARGMAGSLSLRGRQVPLLVLNLLLAPLLAWNIHAWMDDGLADATRAELAQLSGMVVEGGFSTAEGPRVFMGTLDAARWMALSGTERRAEAQGLADSLRRKNVDNALFSAGGRVVIRVENGAVAQVD